MEEEKNGNKIEKPLNVFWENIFSQKKKSGPITNIDVLKYCPLFENLTSRELKKVLRIIHERKYQAGEFLFEMGQPGAAMFIVKSGLIKIVVPGADGEETGVATVISEDFLGELALLDDTPRSASAKAVDKTEVLAFFREDLNEMLKTYPAIASKILRELSIIIGKRLKACNEQLYPTDMKNECI